MRHLILIVSIFISTSAFAEWFNRGGHNNASLSCPYLKSFPESHPWKKEFYNDPWFYCYEWLPTPENPDPDPCPQEDAVWNQETFECEFPCPEGTIEDVNGNCLTPCPDGSMPDPVHGCDFRCSDGSPPFQNGQCPGDPCGDGTFATEYASCPDPEDPPCDDPLDCDSGGGSSSGSGDGGDGGDSGGGSSSGSGDGGDGGDSGGGSSSGSGDGGDGGDGGDSGGGSSSGSGDGGGSGGSGGSGGDGEGNDEEDSTGTASGFGACTHRPECDGDAIQCAILISAWHDRCKTDQTYTEASDCDNPPQCDGDPIQCGIAKEAWKTRCIFDFDKQEALTDFENSLENVDSDGDGIIDALDPEGTDVGQVIDVDSIFSGNDLLGGGACPSPITETILGKTVSLDFGYMCQIANILRPLVIALGYLFAGIILFNGIVRK